jgi:hypothetical protein
LCLIGCEQYRVRDLLISKFTSTLWQKTTRWIMGVKRFAIKVQEIKIIVN